MHQTERTPNHRLSWDAFFASQSRVMALRSTCTRLSVGCVIVRDKRMIASGYNGSINHDEHCLDVGCKVVDGHCVRAIHAEQNALLQCARFGIATEGADLYVTHLPCLHCTKSIIQAGIQNIFYETVYRPDAYAQELLQTAGVNIRQVKSELEWLIHPNGEEI
ncbi:ComE operon protein 2 [Alicyclobacillus dauci]|uniref:ComE operon protein 2 n=1 Tax=Alicyclobacillus dauci TaxID=1475485 RepID=A0ABY6Z3L5_9BACL|nr:ComE operon protein 2 [Alicyclobacillus dauci]WAH37345.1 ComE operon protein 2 [Alicyclobacillus dauci]